MKKTDLILVLDFGGQYSLLITRRLREQHVYSELHKFDTDLESYLKEKAYNLKGIILSGGPASVLESSSPKLPASTLQFIKRNEIPVLGICYGMQLLAFDLGGKLHRSTHREYGHTNITIAGKSKLLTKLGKKLKVWMSHGDSIDKLPAGFKQTSKSKNGIISSAENVKEKLFGVQFHPEVLHTENGTQILKNFITICGIKNFFKPKSFIDEKINEIKNTAGDDIIICALSGGVDSSVAAILTDKAAGRNLHCFHIDNGLMRKDESKKVIDLFKKNFHLNVKLVDASDLFLTRLKGITDPEQKRKIIGRTFIEVFEKEASGIKNAKYLLQGTLYPDVIESVSHKGPSVTIKTHHNVGGLPEKMKFKLIEPFRELFKDEVREIGKKLGLPSYFINRHPFPGPGLAIRVLSDVTKEKLDILREADEIYMSALREFKLYDKIWQAFAVLLPVQTVGVMGDERSYENVIGLRAVTSSDGMTADFYHFEKDFLTYVSSSIINRVKGVNRVVYDISTKPPATIEWE